jgi:hypothetical protein
MATTTSKSIHVLINEWRQLKSQLDEIKARENELRQAIASSDELFDQSRETGTQTFDLGHGWKIKCEKKLNYSVENKQGEAFAALHAIASLGPVEEHQTKKLMSFSPSLSLTVYRELSDEARRIIDKIVTTKPAMPTVTLVEPPTA